MDIVKLGPNDVLVDTDIVTSGYFPGGLGALRGNQFTTSSLSATQKKYYINLEYSNTTVLGVAYGHSGGSGSTAAAILAGVGHTQAIYNSYAAYLLKSEDIEGGFYIEKTNTSTPTYDHDIYVLSAQRGLMGDKLNAGSWTLCLSGSGGPGSAGSLSASRPLYLTDDSKVIKNASSPVGDRHGIYSGSRGTLSSSSEPGKRYGWFYPDLGAMVFSAAALSSSIPGAHIDSGSIKIDDLYNGFSSDLSNDGTANNSLKFAAAVINAGTELQIMRGEEYVTTATYFCRALSKVFNATSNPTMATGSRAEYFHPSMQGNEQTYVTTIGLWNNKNQMVATGRLSSPLNKNMHKEITIKAVLQF
jgi:hypothetical protein